MPKLKITADVIIDGLERASYSDLEEFCSKEHVVRIEFIMDFSDDVKRPVLIIRKEKV